MNYLKTIKLPRILFKSEHPHDPQIQKDSTSSIDNSNISPTSTSDQPIEIDLNSFTTDSFLDLVKKVSDDDWSFLCTRENSLGQCLLSATKLVLAGIADQNQDCKKFIEIFIPDVFKKLLYSHDIDSWVHEIQLHILNMIDLLIDLIAARLSYPPVPVRLLETLAMLFDYDSVFQRKHKDKPYQHSLDKELGDRVLATPPSSSIFLFHNRNSAYGWLCQIINRFVLKNGIKNLRKQFQDEQSLTAVEYDALLTPFVNCMNYLIKKRFQQLFSEEIDQTFDYVQDLNEEAFQAISINDTFKLLSTLRKLYSAAWPNRLRYVNEVHLNLIQKTVVLSNSDVKMNSLKELAKIIDNCTSNNIETSIPHDMLKTYLLEKSILCKILEGNIDEKQYVQQIRTLINFIAPYISKEDIEKIWKMQSGRSFVTILHLFTLITVAAAKFNQEQLNHLTDCIYQSWKTETMSMQEKLIVLLGTIGRECQKESAAPVLNILWDMAHEDRLNRSMLDRLFSIHCSILNKDSFEYNALKREYCLKCVDHLQTQQGWITSAIKYLKELLSYNYNQANRSEQADENLLSLFNQTNKFKQADQRLVSLLVSADLIPALIQSISSCQKNAWDKTQGDVKVNTLVDDYFTIEESIQIHLDLLSFLLKQGNIHQMIKHIEQLWDILITNDRASSFGRELGFSWFIDSLENIDRESQTALFEKHVSDLDPIYLCPLGIACYKLYYENCNRLRNLSSNSRISSIRPTTSGDLNSLICVRQGDLTAEQTDVIVVCSSSRTLLEAVFKAGGNLLKTSYETESKKNSTAAIITVAASGQLAAKTVYFLPWQPNVNVTEFCKSIEKFVSTAMNKAASENYQTIAFPAIGCGEYGCPIDLVAQTIIDKTYRQLAISKNPIFVSFVIQTDKMNIYNEFQKQIKLIQPKPEIKPVLMTVGKGTIEVEMGDITAQKVDVIIGSSTSQILKTQIINAAGSDVLMAYVKEYRNSPNSLITSLPSGQLPCKRIFFVKWESDTNEEVLQQSIVDFIWSTIQNVVSHKFTSIALPAIGCGNQGYSKDIIVKTMVKEMKNHLKMRNLPLTVKFIVQPEQREIFDEFCKQVLSSQEDISTSPNNQLPSTWVRSTDNKIRFIVPTDTDEFKSIGTNFDQTMKGKYVQIIQIERIQNERWYMQYLAHFRDFNKRFGTNTEKRLYHGCPEQPANLIIEDCFNRSFAGVNGTVYGFGVYFSSNATYSHGYATPNGTGKRFMFLSRVLVGKSIIGNTSMKTRPVGCDSTTDGNHIFVTYHDAQAYAEYLITYK